MINRFLFDFIKTLFQYDSVSKNSLPNTNYSQSSKFSELEDLNTGIKKNKTLLYISYFLIALGLFPFIILFIGGIGVLFMFAIMIFNPHCGGICSLIISLTLGPVSFFGHLPFLYLLIGASTSLVIGLIFLYKYKQQNKQIINLNK